MQKTWVQSLGCEDPLEKGKDAAAAAKSLQSCPTLCDPIDGSLPGSSVHGIFQARVLEFGAIADEPICQAEYSLDSLSSVPESHLALHPLL